MRPRVCMRAEVDRSWGAACCAIFLATTIAACGGEYLSAVEPRAPTPALQAEPGVIERGWLRRGDVLSAQSRLWRSDGGELSSLRAGADQPWLAVTLVETSEEHERGVTISIDTAALEAGEHAGEVTLTSATDAFLPRPIPVRARVWALSDLHLGVVSGTCPHLLPDGLESDVCDHTGADALASALAARGSGDVRLLLHDADDDGDPELAEYRGCVDLPGRTWIEAAPDADPRLVVISCADPDGDWPGGVLRLTGDESRVARLSLVSLRGSRHALTAVLDPDDPGAVSGGHMLENLYVASLNPELIWSNGIGAPFALGPDTTLRNSRVYGYFDGQLDLRRAARSRLLHNTFVFYQSPLGPMDARGAGGLVFANNVVVSLAAPLSALLLASDATAGLTVTGNAVEGYQAMVEGIAAGAAGLVDEDNWLGEIEIASPYRPSFLADAARSTGHRVLGEGESLEGIDIAGQRELLPGALQQRRTASGPRSHVVRVGDANSGDEPCGGHPCDAWASWPNELQIAVWSAWPGAEIEIYPAAAPYAGNAIISWGVTLRGVSDEDAPPIVVLQSEEEDAKAAQWGLWSRHGSMLVVQDDVTTAPVRIENLILRVDGLAQASATAVFIEGTGARVPASPHVIQRVKIETVDGEDPAQALYLGDNVRVQDVLIEGPFGACARFGPQHAAPTPMPETPTTRGWVINTTCRLTGEDAAAPRAAFEVDWVDGTLFANLVLQVGAPLFLAERSPPTSFTARAITAQGRSADCAPFACGGAPAYVFSDIVDVAVGAVLFASGTDSHLDPAEVGDAIDGGHEFWIDYPDLPLGRALDGVDRRARDIDRGAYEQGD